MRSSPVAILYEYYIINLKDRNIPPKKHYEIPFLRRCIAVFPFTTSDRTTSYIAEQETTHYEIPFVRSIPCSSTSSYP